MTLSKSALLVAIAALIATPASQLIAPTPAQADTFAIFNLGTDNGYSIYGIDTSGTVVIDSFRPAPGLADDILYQTYVDGVLINSARTIPNLNYDNGTPGTPMVSPPVTWSSGADSVQQRPRGLLRHLSRTSEFVRQVHLYWSGHY
jgi:hypothetical protein